MSNSPPRQSAKRRRIKSTAKTLHTRRMHFALLEKRKARFIQKQIPSQETSSTIPKQPNSFINKTFKLVFNLKFFIAFAILSTAASFILNDIRDNSIRIEIDSLPTQLQNQGVSKDFIRAYLERAYDRYLSNDNRLQQNLISVPEPYSVTILPVSTSIININIPITIVNSVRKFESLLGIHKNRSVIHISTTNDTVSAIVETIKSDSSQIFTTLKSNTIEDLSEKIIENILTTFNPRIKIFYDISSASKANLRDDKTIANNINNLLKESNHKEAASLLIDWAYLLFKTDKREEAICKTNLAISIDPLCKDAFAFLGFLYLANAVDKIASYPKEDILGNNEIDIPNSDAVIFVDDSANNPTEDFRQAITPLLHAFEIDPNDITTCSNLLVAYVGSRQHSAALDLIQNKIIKIKKLTLDTGILHSIFVVYLQTHTYELALAAAKQLTERLPTFAYYRTKYANILYKTGNHDEAIKQFNIAIKFNPHCATIFYNSPGFIENDKQYDTTIQLVKESIELAPNDAKLYFTYAHLLILKEIKTKSDFDNAEVALQKAIQIDPSKPLYYKDLVDIYRGRKKIKELHSLCKEYADHNFTDYIMSTNIDNDSFIRDTCSRRPIQGFL